METDYTSHLVKDLLMPGQYKYQIKKTEETTYILIENSE